MSTRRRFTEEEDKVILSKISENPGNVAQCLRELSAELNRSYSTLQTRWYKILSKKCRQTGFMGTTTIRGSKVSFMTYGKNTANPNRKIVREDTQQPIRVRKSKWRRILDILFE